MKVIGIDVGATKISAGLVNNNKLIKILKTNTEAHKSQNEIIKNITKLIDQLIDNSVKGIGLGVPAIIDLKKGMAYEAANIPSWKKVPLKQILEKKYRIPVKINNDAKCFALGENKFGEGKGYDSMAGITIGTGFGTGIIIEGKIYCGYNCGAGEFGQIKFKDKDIDFYCSGEFFLKKYKLKGEQLQERAERKDQKALKIYREFGDNLGKALSTVINSIDPELIVLGGSVSQAYPFFKQSMLSSLKQNIYQRTFSRLKIKVSKNKEISVLGAASLI